MPNELDDLRIVYYKDDTSVWRWQLYTKNNKKIASAGRGYSSLIDCKAGFRILQHINWDIEFAETVHNESNR